MRRRRIFVMLIALVAAASPASAATDPERIAAAAKALADSGRYQTSFVGEDPLADEPNPATPSGPDIMEGTCVGEECLNQEYSQPPGAIPTAARLALWAAMFAALGLMAAPLFGALSFDPGRRSRRPRTGGDSAAADFDEASNVVPQDQVLAQAHALADAGEVAEAAHFLLEAAAARLRRADRTLKRSSTSREHLRRLKADTPAAEAFASLVRTVEMAIYRRDAIDRGEFDRCLANYARFAGAIGGSAA